MKNPPKNKTPKPFPLKRCAGLLLLLGSLLVIAEACKSSNKFSDTYENVEKDSVGSVQAFAKVYSVLMSPRCMNCHPVGDIPLQGDDSHLHTMAPKRGEDGKGLYAMKCSNCHQPKNVPGVHTPPGNPKWHMPPADMKMVFQGKSPHELAKQLVNPEKNGHKSMEDLKEHVHDTLVVAGWHPGEGRTLPPLSYEEFKAAWLTWIEKGAYAPPPGK